MKGKKIKELFDTVKSAVMDEKDGVVLESQDPEDCIDRMGNKVDEFVKEFVDDDSFFKNIPEETPDLIKQALSAVFENAYVSSSFFLFF